jgi:hypothetical protein
MSAALNSMLFMEYQLPGSQYLNFIHQVPTLN